MDSRRPEQAGAGSAVNDTTREIGGTLGVAVLGSVLTSVYASSVAERIGGLGLPRHLAEIADQSVMGGAEVASRTPASMSERMTVAVQEVFVEGLHSAVWVAVVVTAAAAVAAAVLLRGGSGSRTTEPESEQASEVEGEVIAARP